MKSTEKDKKIQGSYTRKSSIKIDNKSYDIDAAFIILKPNLKKPVYKPLLEYGEPIEDRQWPKIEGLFPRLQEIDAFAVVAKTREGLPGKQAQELAKRLDLTDQEIARILTVSARTYHRQKTGEQLNSVASERLLLLTKLADHGLDVFEDQGKFNRWLRRPLRVLGSQTPLELLDTSTGIGMVETILERIDYGVYS